MEDGSTSGSYTKVVAAFERFYKKLLGTKKVCESINREAMLIGSIISDSQGEDLINEITIFEIKAALESIGNDKSSEAIYSYNATIEEF